MGDRIRVVVLGTGQMGSGVIRLLEAKAGVRVVGVYGRRARERAVDAGVAAGLGRRLGFDLSAMGCPEAVRIPESRPGLACTDRWGLDQTFDLDKHMFTQSGPKAALNQHELQLAQRALNEADGKMSIPLLVAWGLPERGARSLVESWELRGWLHQDSTRQNARYITPKLLEILSNSQSGQTASSTSNW